MQERRYRQYKELAKKITKGDERYMDLLHDVLIQLESNEKWKGLNTKEEQLYFLTKTLTNQFYSNSSKFQRTYKRQSFMELQQTIELEDTIYSEQPTMEWIKETLEIELKKNPDFWYNKGIFELWIEHKGFIERIHKQTQIPRYSLKDTIEKVKQLLNKRWREYNNAESKT